MKPDPLNGGAGSDTVVYSDNTTSLRIDLASHLVTFVDQTWRPEAICSERSNPSILRASSAA